MNAFEDFVKRVNPVLYQYLDEVEFLDFLARSKKTKDGFTFLMPTDEYMTFMKENLQDDEDLVDEFKSMVILKYLKSPMDWNIHTNELINLHGRLITVKSITGRAVTIEGDPDVELSLEKKFNDATNTVSIFTINRGRVVKGKTKARKQKVTNDVKPDIMYRRQIFVDVINKQNVYKECMSVVASFFKYLATSNSNLLEAILPFLDHCPITNFIILFEPLKGDCFFLDDVIINNWYPQRSKITNFKKFYTNTLESVKNLSSTTYTSPIVYKNVVQEIRENLQDLVSPIEFIRTVHKKYNELCNTNKLSADGNIDNILPRKSFEYIKSRNKPGHNIKLVQDEIRTMVCSLKEEGMTYKNILVEVTEELNLYPQVMDTTILETTSKMQAIANLTIFINTTHFLYLLPIKCGDFGGKPGRYADVNPDDEADLDKLVIDLIPNKIKEFDFVKINNVSQDRIEESIQDLIETGGVPSESLLRSAKQLIAGFE